MKLQRSELSFSTIALKLLTRGRQPKLARFSRFNDINTHYQADTGKKHRPVRTVKEIKLAAESPVGNRFKIVMRIARCLWCCSTKTMAMLLCIVIPSHAFAVPPDPQRPFDVSTCADAKQRFREALSGSPLISATEMAEVTALARDWTKRLCGPEAVKEIITDFENKDCKKTK